MDSLKESKTVGVMLQCPDCKGNKFVIWVLEGEHDHYVVRCAGCDCESELDPKPGEQALKALTAGRSVRELKEGRGP